MIFDRVAHLIEDQFGIDTGRVKPTTTFEDLNFDESNVVEFLLAVESEFEVDIAGEDAESFETIQDVIDLIEDSLERKVYELI